MKYPFLCISTMKVMIGCYHLDLLPVRCCNQLFLCRSLRTVFDIHIVDSVFHSCLYLFTVLLQIIRKGTALPFCPNREQKLFSI